MHTDDMGDYDDVASHSTVDDTTPQTSSENASMSEMPFEARFKTFVKQKKNKNSTSTAGVRSALVDSYDKRLPPPPTSEDTDNEPSANLLSEHYADALPIRANGNGTGSAHVPPGSGVESDFRVSNNSVSHLQTNGAATKSDDNDEDELNVGDQDNNEHENHIKSKRATVEREENEDDTDDSADEDVEDAEEGVYDLGTSNLFLD